MTESEKLKDVPREVSALLLLLSRSRLTEDEKQIARALAARVDDWNLFCVIAYRKFCLTWAHYHLKQIGFEIPNEEVRNDLDVLARRMIMGTLQVTGAQIAFHKTCIKPLGVDHVYLKGPTLAARYHSNPTLRFCRDVDLLVSPEDYEAVVRRALSHGYLLWNDPIETPCAPTERDIKAVLKYADAVAVTAPDGTLVEIHREVDKHSGFFNTHDLLNQTEELRTGGETLKVLSTPALLTYICYHHTRHTWSRLHWLADLDAIRTHESFDHDATLAYARERGLGEIVAASLQFCELTTDPSLWEHTDRSDKGAQLLDLCLANLGGDLALEYSIRSNFGLLGLPFEWMVSPGMKWQIRARHMLSRLQPNFAQYYAWPLPSTMQWLYYFTRPLSSAKRRIFGA